MARFKQEEAGEDGWSEWVAPIMKGYKIACCDCGLVHEMEFRAAKVTSGSSKGVHRVRMLPASKFVVQFRVRRNNRSTAQIRRHMKGATSNDDEKVDEENHQKANEAIVGKARL